MKDRRKVNKYPVNGIRICIDKCANYDVCGRIYSKLSSDPLMFHDCRELLLKTDEMFDENGFPQAFQERRCFTEAPHHCYHSRPDPMAVDDDLILEQNGSVKTVDVIVRTRQKSSWQGILKTRDDGVTEFHSELELFRWIWNQVPVASCVA